MIPYVLRGALPAGDYVITASGFQPSKDAHLHADVTWHPQHGADQLIVSADSNYPVGSDAGVPGDIMGTFPGKAVPATCGDQLILTLKMVTGSTGYIEFGVGMSIP